MLKTRRFLKFSLTLNTPRSPFHFYRLLGNIYCDTQCNARRLSTVACDPYIVCNSSDTVTCRAKSDCWFIVWIYLNYRNTELTVNFTHALCLAFREVLKTEKNPHMRIWVNYCWTTNLRTTRYSVDETLKFSLLFITNNTQNNSVALLSF